MPDFELELQETEDERIVHVVVTGELDLTNAGELEDGLTALAQRDATALLLDLNRVVFIDSAALHVLFRAAGRLGRDRLGLVVADSAPIARTVAIVGLPHAAVTGETTEAVLEALGR